jgi:hypothetical protein
VLAIGAGGVAALVRFVFVERRSPHPLVPLGLFADRSFSVANAVTVVVYAGRAGRADRPPAAADSGPAAGHHGLVANRADRAQGILPDRRSAGGSSAGAGAHTHGGAAHRNRAGIGELRFRTAMLIGAALLALGAPMAAVLLREDHPAPAATERVERIALERYSHCGVTGPQLYPVALTSPDRGDGPVPPSPPASG